MRITILGRQVDVTNDMKALVDKKLAKLDKFFPNEAEAYVTFTKKRMKENIEITISNAGTLFRCEESDETFQNAIDSAVDTIVRQIRKNKTRLEKRLRKGAFSDLSANVPGGDLKIEEETDYKIRVKHFPFKPMTPEEAILQMNLLGHSFYVFVNSDSHETCVVYRRNDGAYGLIEPGEDE